LRCTPHGVCGKEREPGQLRSLSFHQPANASVSLDALWPKAFVPLQKTTLKHTPKSRQKKNIAPPLSNYSSLAEPKVDATNSELEHLLKATCKMSSQKTGTEIFETSVC
jgi:hypothetical protein